MKNEERKDNRTELSKMGKLLLSGATMLNESCPDCKIPLFKKEGKIFCPQCERKAIYAKDDNEKRQIEQNLSLEEATSQLRDILTGKLTFLANQLASSDDLKSINQLLQSIEKVLEIIRRIP